jgi:hypothetical protein
VIKSSDEKPHVLVRLSSADAQAFQQRIQELARDVEAAETPGGEEYELVATLYPSGGLR